MIASFILQEKARLRGGGCDVTTDGVNNCSVEHTCRRKKIKRNAIWLSDEAPTVDHFNEK